MPIHYEIDLKMGLVRTVATGTLTDDDVLAHKRALLDDPLYHSGMQELSDVRGVEKLAVTREGIKQMVSWDDREADRLTGHRLAIVASANLTYGMARMYQMSGEGGPQAVGVFRTVEEAQRWLAE